MRYVLALLVLLYATPSKAEEIACYPPHALIHGLMLQGFLPAVEIEIEKSPAMIFVHPSGDFAVFALIGNHMCEIAHGRAWNPVKERKA
jgi:hypothetical protein